MAWFKTKEDAKKFEDSWPTIPTGRYEAIALSPLGRERLIPDIILIYGTPAQIILLINGLQYED